MQRKHLYEYAVIRILPKVEREEFINIGIIIFSKQARFIKMIYSINKDKISVFSDEVDWEYVESTLKSFEQISKGIKEGGLIAQLDISERFRWLTSPRSTSIQTSRPHPGFSSDLDKTANKLFQELVL